MPRTYADLSDFSNVPASTLWHRAHGRPSREEKAKCQQYLTPSEEKALVNYALRLSNNGYPIPVQYLRSLARKTKLGADHPDTLTSMANLASTYSNQGRWEEAEKRIPPTLA
jgi:hypothetical protein